MRRSRLLGALVGFVLAVVGVALAQPPAAPGERVFPIDLPTALRLGDARSIDVLVAAQRTRAALAQQHQAQSLWLPTIVAGVDYFHHDGPTQNADASLTTASRGSFMAGAGPTAIIPLTDALFGPLAAKQVLRARAADQQAAANDTLLAVAEAFFNVQQARGELASDESLVDQADTLAHRVEALAGSLAPPMEAARARAERARRRQAAISARERWRTASAELARLIRLEPGVLVEPVEPPNLLVTLVHPGWKVDELIPIGLTNRPELASRQALVLATLQRLRQEKLRPLVPSVLLRGASTNPAGTLGYGTFGGGPGGTVGGFGGRTDLDVQLLWEVQGLGFGNKARVEERRAEHQAAILEVFRVQDRIAAEVTTALAQVHSALDRLPEAEAAVRDAIDSLAKNLEGLRQTRRIGDTVVLVVRPQEAVAAVQALALAYADYYAAIADHNRAQFRLYRALGHPAACVLDGSVVAAETATPAAGPGRR